VHDFESVGPRPNLLYSVHDTLFMAQHSNMGRLGLGPTNPNHKT
jgi:hypothetical protein